MLDSIINLVKNEAFKAVTNNNSVPEEKKDAAVEATTSGIVDGLKDQLTPNNLSNLMNIFGGGSTSSNSLASSVESSVVSSLIQKVGLSPGVANTIASTVIPAVMGMISKKHNDPNDSFSIESLAKSLTNNKGGVLGAIGGLFGK